MVGEGNFTERVCIDNLVVDCLKPSDQKFFLKLVNDEVVKKYFAFGENLEEQKSFFKECILNNTDEKSLYLAIRFENGTYPIGMFNLFYHSNNSWIVEYALLNLYRGEGYIKKVLTYLLQNSYEFLNTFYLKQNGKIESLRFQIESSNIPSMKLIDYIEKRLGYSVDFNGLHYVVTL